MREISGTVTNTYTKNGCNYAYFVTNDGNCWEVKSDAYAIGENHTIIMHKQGTDEVYDDIVIKIL